MNVNIEMLKKIGGREWTKNNTHRIYFNNLADLFGIKAKYYNTGNLRSATARNWNGSMSNSAMSALIHNLACAKFWFDVKTEQFQSKIPSKYAEEIHQELVAEIDRRVAALTE